MLAITVKRVAANSFRLDEWPWYQAYPSSDGPKLSIAVRRTIPLIAPSLAAPGGAWPVQIGAVWHSAWEVENVLKKFCKPIFALTGDAQFPYSRVGSAAAVKLEGRHFVFCCRHQIREYTPDQIAIPLSFEAKIMSATSARRLAADETNRGGDTTDVAVFEYNVDDYGVPNLTSEFFPAEDTRIWPTGTAQMPFMVFGYPTTRQQFREERIGARSVVIQAVYDGGTSSPHLQRVKMERPLDADGLSGGPVFYVGGRPGSFFVGFAGMIMRGGRQSSSLHFMAADFLFQMAFESRTLPWTEDETPNIAGA